MTIRRKLCDARAWRGLAKIAGANVQQGVRLHSLLMISETLIVRAQCSAPPFAPAVSVARVLALARANELIDGIIAVLLCKETAGLLFERIISTQQLALLGAAVGDVDAGRLVILLAGTRCRCVPSKRKESKRLRILGADVEGPDAVQCVELVVQRIAAVFPHEQLVLVGKVDVVKRVVHLVTEEEDRDRAIILFHMTIIAIVVAIVLAEVDTEDGAPGAASGELWDLAGRRIGVAGGSEEEGTELGVRQPSQILRTLERRGAGSFGQSRGGAQAHRVVLGWGRYRHPFDRIGRSWRMELELRNGQDVRRRIGRERHRRAVNDDLQRLQCAAILDPLRIVWDVSIDEGIRLCGGLERNIVGAETARSGATNILNEIDVAFVVITNAFVAAKAEEIFQCVNGGRPVQRHLNNLAGPISGRTCLLREQQGFCERIERAAIDGAESRRAARITRSQQSDAMVRVSDIEIDARNVGLVATVLVALEQKMPAIVEAGGWTAGVMVKDEIGVLVGLGGGTIAEKAEFGDNTV